MHKITALTVQKRNKDRVNVFLDGEYAFSLAMHIAAGLRLGQSLSDDQIEDMQFSDSVEKAKQNAYRYLSYRPRSISETQTHLRNRGYDQSTIEKVIDRLTELELLDDWEFAQYWVEQRETFKPRGRLALRQELYQKGLSREIIDASVATVDEKIAALNAAQRKADRWSHLSKEEFFLKLGRYLQRRGFSYELIATVCQELWEKLDQNDVST